MLKGNQDQIEKSLKIKIRCGDIKMSYLVVVAHPDDEVLGAGGTIYTLTGRNEAVDVCILSGMAEARTNRPLSEDTDKCLKLLGVRKKFLGDFPNIKFNTVPHLDLVQFIERIIIETGADTIFTHHPADLNNDHLQTSLACQAAARLFQRRGDVHPLRELLYMEIPSATEWALNNSVSEFRPNAFFEIGKDGIEKKIEALELYQGVMRKYPHPRSREALLGLAAYRGSQSGNNYAESFESAIRRLK